MKKERIINFIKLFIVLFLFFNLSSVIVYLLKEFGINTSIFNGKDVAYLNALIELIVFGVVYLLYHKKIKDDFDKLKLNSKDSVSKIFNYFALFLGIKIGFALITGVLSALLGLEVTSSENQNAIDSITNNAPLMMLISTSLLAPFVEEGIFRLGIKNVVKNKYAFILISGLIFGFMHIFPTDLVLYEALIQSIVYVAMGVYLAYIYSETDNIWISIIVHGLNNLLSMAALLLF